MTEQVDAVMARARRFISQDLWNVDISSGRLFGFATRILQLSVMITQGFVRDHLILRASALTYVTLLSVIPLLAVALSIVRIFDPNNNLATTAVEYLAAGSPEAQSQILEMIRSANIAGLGSVGAAVLFVSSIFALRHLETTMNSIWGVRKDRTIARRFTDYLAVIVVVPLLLGLAISLGASMASDPILGWFLEIPSFASLYDLGLAHVPKLFLLLGFTFIYWFFPNTNVRFPSAFFAGLLAMMLFLSAQKAYLGLNIGVAKYSALYGGFAALPLLFVWIFVCWAIILLGAEFSFAYQNLSHYRLEVQSEDLSPSDFEALGIHIAVEVGRGFRDREPAPSDEDLAERLNVSVRAARSAISRLEIAQVLCLSASEESPGYRLGRPAEKIRIADLLKALRGQRRNQRTGGTDEDRERVVEDLVRELEQGLASVSESRTLADVLTKIPEQ